jgi:carboxyl-terminal processing protease
MHLARPKLHVAVALAATMLAAGGPLAQDAARPLPSAAAAQRDEVLDYGRLLDAVIERIEARFFDTAKLRQLNWAETARAQRPRIAASASLAEAARRINDLLALLKTSHTAFYTPDEVSYAILLDAVGAGDGGELQRKLYWANAPHMASIGAFTAEVDGRHFIDAVLQGSPAARAGLLVGDEIAAVDGAPYHPVRSFRQKVGRTAQVSIRRTAEGALEAREVEVVAMVPGLAFSSATADSSRVIERNGRRIGYMQVWASRNSDAFRAALARLSPGSIVVGGEVQRFAIMRGGAAGTAGAPAGTLTSEPLDAIIVDMRGKIGGSAATTREYLEMLGAFQSTAQFVFKGRPERGAGGNAQQTAAQKRNPPFRGRAVLLIDHHTRSAAEMFAYAFKREGMGPLIGTPTAGAVSAGALAVMPGDNLLYIAVSGITADGEVLEGRGVAPDIRIERPLPYSAGADPVLDAAVEHLAKR